MKWVLIYFWLGYVVNMQVETLIFVKVIISFFCNQFCYKRNNIGGFQCC